MATIIIPVPLRKYTENAATFTVSEADTIGNSLISLTNQYPETRRFLMTQNGNIQSFVGVYVDEEDIKCLQGEGTRVEADTVISLIPSIIEL